MAVLTPSHLSCQSHLLLAVFHAPNIGTPARQPHCVPCHFLTCLHVQISGILGHALLTDWDILFHIRGAGAQSRPYWPSYHQTCPDYSLSGPWTSCSLYLECCCPRSSMTHYFYHSGSSLSIISPRRLTLITLSKLSIPIPASSSLILFNYPLLKFLAYFVLFYYLYPSFQ